MKSLLLLFNLFYLAPILFLIRRCGNVGAEDNLMRCGSIPGQIPREEVCPELATSCFVLFNVSINLSWNESFYWCIKQKLELVWIKSEAEARWLLNKTYELKRINSEIDGIHINLRESSYCSEGRTWCWPNGDVQDTSKKVSDENPFAWLAGHPKTYPGRDYCAQLWFNTTGHLGIDDILCERDCDKYEYHPIVICRMKRAEKKATSIAPISTTIFTSHFNTKQAHNQSVILTMKETEDPTRIAIISTATTSRHNENASKYRSWMLILFCTLLGIIFIVMPILVQLNVLMGNKSEKQAEMRMSREPGFEVHFSFRI